MFRTALLAVALVSTPAFAGHYQAKPTGLPSVARFVAKDVVWKCGDSGCTASKSNSRPAIVCAALAREVGRIDSFSAGGEALPADQLEKCNARAQ